MSVLKNVIAKVTAEQQIDYHEKVFVVLEGQPEVDEERVVERLQEADFTDNVSDCIALYASRFVHVLHGEQATGILLLNDAHLRTRNTRFA